MGQERYELITTVELEPRDETVVVVEFADAMRSRKNAVTVTRCRKVIAIL
jgi:hypothetical protein